MDIKVTVTVELIDPIGHSERSVTMPSVITAVVRESIGGNPGYHAAEAQRAVVKAHNKMIAFLEPHVFYRQD